MYQSNKISLWERVKRIIAHAFETQTKAEIHEHFERLQWEEDQQQLRLAHAEHVEQLMLEYAPVIEAVNKEREEKEAWEKEQARLKRIEDKRKKEMEERVRLYKSNRELQMQTFYREVAPDTFEEVAVAETSTDTE